MASIVVIPEAPMLSTGVMQERVAAPSTCTVQARQSAMPQPNFVPVMPSTSRNTHRSGVSPSTSTVRSTPLTLILVAMGASMLLAYLDAQRHSPSTIPAGLRSRLAGDHAVTLFPTVLLADPPSM